MTIHPLGRRIRQDPRSRNFRVNPSSAPAQSKRWDRKTGVFDQGTIGSCTGNALVGVAATVPFELPRKRYDEKLAVAVYERATQIDDLAGVYPPDDTGSSGLAAAKAAVERKLATAYYWGFGIDDLTQTVAHVGPCAVGTDWHHGFDTPDAGGLVARTGASRGGHEYEVIGWHADTSLGAPIAGVFECVNSWGRKWGVDGRFYVRHADMAANLADHGDCVTLRDS